MDTVFNAFGLGRWWGRLRTRFTVGLTLKLSAWLADNASTEWRRIVRLHEPQGTQRPGHDFAPTHGMDSEVSAAPVAVSKKGFESPDIELLSQDITQQSVQKSQLPRWVSEVQPFLQNQLSSHTRRAYESDLKQFFRFLDGRAELSELSELRPQHIILFRKALEEGRVTGKPLAQATVNRKLAVVKSFFNWLRVNQVVRENPAQLVKGYPQSQESSLQGLSDEEVRRILGIPNANTKAGALHTAVLNVLLYLGLRKGELIGLQMGDLDRVRGVDVLKVKGKGHRVRILPVTAKVKQAIEHYLWACKRDRSATEAPLFTPTKNPRGGVLIKPLNPNAITYMVARYAKKAGITKTISPHSCRATCISNALDRKASHRSVQSLAGWSTPLMIQRYDKRREDLQNSAAFQVDYSQDDEEAAS